VNRAIAAAIRLAGQRAGATMHGRSSGMVRTSLAHDPHVRERLDRFGDAGGRSARVDGQRSPAGPGRRRHPDDERVAAAHLLLEETGRVVEEVRFQEFEQTSSARSPVAWTGVVRTGRISCKSTGCPRRAACQAASDPGQTAADDDDASCDHDSFR